MRDDPLPCPPLVVRRPRGDRLRVWRQREQFAEGPADTVRVVDVGCGNGRSTRALLEFGVRPQNVVGLDLRMSAIEYARTVNPAIAYSVEVS
jgi:SAM-dependent methyltransferase